MAIAELTGFPQPLITRKARKTVSVYLNYCQSFFALFCFKINRFYECPRILVVTFYYYGSIAFTGIKKIPCRRSAVGLIGYGGSVCACGYAEDRKQYYYKSKGIMSSIDGSKSMEDVLADIRTALEK